MKIIKRMSSAWQEVTSGERNQVVFEYLNKTYGAYQIRTNYDRTLFKVFFASGLCILLISAAVMLTGSKAPLVLKFPDSDPTIFTPNKIVDPVTLPKIKTPPPSSPKTPEANVKLNPVITTDPEKGDDKNILPEKPNHDPTTGVPCDSCKDVPGPGPITGGPVDPNPAIDPILGLEGVDVFPQFPGGDAEMYRFLKNNTRIPESIIDIGSVKEKVGIVFVVGKDGSITDISLISSSKYKELNEEAVRVVKKMPKWIPGMQNGNPVKVRFIIPLRFEVK